MLRILSEAPVAPLARSDGTAAVVVAAGLVAWTASPWPDLVVAVVIAGLFLQSSWSIIRDARSDLNEAASASARAPA